MGRMKVPAGERAKSGVSLTHASEAMTTIPTRLGWDDNSLANGLHPSGGDPHKVLVFSRRRIWRGPHDAISREQYTQSIRSVKNGKPVTVGVRDPGTPSEPVVWKRSLVTNACPLKARTMLFRMAFPSVDKCLEDQGGGGAPSRRTGDVK